MLCAENEAKIREWIATREGAEAVNHPMVVWRGFIASQERDRPKSQAWRTRNPATLPMVYQVLTNVRPLLPGATIEMIREIAFAAIRGMGFAVPKLIRPWLRFSENASQEVTGGDVGTAGRRRLAPRCDRKRLAIQFDQWYAVARPNTADASARRQQCTRALSLASMAQRAPFGQLPCFRLRLA
jgi:hypothetical protein